MVVQKGNKVIVSNILIQAGFYKSTKRM